MLAEGKATSRIGDDGKVVVLADFAGKCERPLRFAGNWSNRNRAETSWEQGTAHMKARCRRCPGCLQVRSAQWGYRCVKENLDHPHEDETREVVRHRTFFVTLTLAPLALYIMEARARAECVRPGEEYITEQGEVRQGKPINDWDALTEHQRSWAIFKEVGREVSKYLKRVRKAYGKRATLRYFMAAETGEQTGREHVHLLVHVTAHVPMLWDELTMALIWKWKHHEVRPGQPLGIATADQIRDPERGGWYVAKYVSKSSHARARASRGYGRAASAAAPPPPVGTSVDPAKRGRFSTRETSGSDPLERLQRRVGRSPRAGQDKAPLFPGPPERSEVGRVRVRPRRT